MGRLGAFKGELHARFLPVILIYSYTHELTNSVRVIFVIRPAVRPARQRRPVPRQRMMAARMLAALAEGETRGVGVGELLG
jgi:hypothetical protein